MKLFIALICLTLSSMSQSQPTKQQPLKIGIAGLTHTHVHWLLGRAPADDIEIVGIAEPNLELATRYIKQHGLSMDLVYPSLEEMIQKTKPEAVTAFGTIYEHLEVVQTCAPLGIHVMVEKPLAVSMDHAQKMAKLALDHDIHLLTNYETTWYPSNHKARDLVEADQIGEIRKIIVRDGHKGPKKIGVNEEFLEWLTDPKHNGGGALMDFGCYGANLMTWLMSGERPLTVTAVAQQLQPENNPDVEDDATILLTYASCGAIIEPSWNWPIGRKDMEIYGETGVLFAKDRNTLKLHMSEGYDGYEETVWDLPERPAPFHDPFALLAAIVRGTHQLSPADLSALENNLIVMEILEAAKASIESKKTISLTQDH
ncbi:Gfo/Idh/MocA family protein [Marinoscillum furvescens]|uniref:Putative dehydrogenase n=1 Tax=Marinoscillum furvescens DSM 4134 TaxID=1122208 RepID=A0A3D9KYC3_MARFU|nr:Gfo/Idh/MocA family oxidoreductase [Marinoscillum furvescens]RED93402.1 putative dehydrogenase [Marinoscillum furvescens DSM 4134]